MKFDKPAGTNPIDQLKVVGQPVDRIDGALKTTGTAPYAYDRHDVIGNPAVGYIVGASVAKGRITSFDLSAAKAAPGVITIVTHQNAGKLGKGKRNTARLLAGPDVQHYHQAVAIVVADTFEQAREAAALVKVQYAKSQGSFDLEEHRESAPVAKGTVSGAPASKVGDFEANFPKAPVQLDSTYRTSHESHFMMEPHATIAHWEGDKLTVWTSNQMIAWTVDDLAATLGIKKDNIRVFSPFIGGGFGGKLFLRSDVVMAALASRESKRPVKVQLHRALMPNNTTHRTKTIGRIRIGCTPEGKITAIAHDTVSGDQQGGKPETAAMQTRALYAGEHRMTAHRLAVLDLTEANAMRAPGEAPGMAVLEVAIDEMAEKLGMDPIAFRIANDTQVVPDNPPKPRKEEEQKSDEKKSEKQQDEKHDPHPPFSKRQLARCFEEGARRFGWSKRSAKPGQVSDGRWLVGMGVAAAFRDNLLTKSAARVRLDRRGRVIVETDMTDIGTGSYTIIAQTAAEVMQVPLDKVVVRLGDSSFPVSCGSGGQWGGNNSTAGVYAACMKLREMMAARKGDEELVAEDKIEYGDLDKQYRQSTFGAHFVEVAVDRYTGETRVRRMLAVCACGRILNPKTARSQVIGAMVMGVGAALMEKLEVDKGRGFFANHDLAMYEVPVHADIPHQEVVFLDEVDPISSPMKAKGVAELGICGVAAAVANAVYNATGVRVRDYPITLDKLLAGLPPVVA